MALGEAEGSEGMDRMQGKGATLWGWGGGGGGGRAVLYLLGSSLLGLDPAGEQSVH